MREELTDDTPVKAELLELQLLLELGDIDDEEYAAREAAIMSRLREVREWREQFGMGVSGGPVRVASTEAESASPATEEPEEAPKVAQPGEATIDVHFDWE